MLNRLIGFSLRHRGLVVALAVLLLAHGWQVASRAKLDVFPDFVPPQVTVQTEAPGLAPEEVEALVTRPLETAVAGLGNQESMRSESIQGLSIITVVFIEGTDIFKARQLLMEKLGEIGAQLPAGVKSPKMSPLTSATMDLLKIGLVTDRLTPMQLRTFADWTLRPRLLAVPGVAKCSVFGGEVRQLQIQVDPIRLNALGLALSDVLGAARLATGVRGAGFIEGANQRIVVQTEGQTLTASALGEVLLNISTNGVPLRLRDVADVVEGAEPKFGDTRIQGHPGVLLTMGGQYGANTLEVTRGVEAALAELQPALTQQGIDVYPRLHRPATFIETALRNMQHSLWIGGALVAVVLFLFLGHLRTAFISITAIPLSLLAAVIALDRLGVTLNTVTLGGLAIAIGEVVDDAIIDVENIFRRLQENVRAGSPRSIFAVVLDASIEVRSAVVFATFIVALVFVPVLTLTGLQGSFFAPLALSYLLAIFASLIIALTLTPALALIFFSRRLPAARETRWHNGLRRAYGRTLDLVLLRPKLLLAAVVVLCAAAILRVPGVSGEFLPEFREGHFVLQVNLAPGTSLPEMLRLGERISAELLADPRIATVEQQAGRAEQGEDPWGPHRCEFHVELKPLPAEEEETMAQAIREILGRFPGIQFEVMTFLGDRIGESITGETAPVVINIFGDDLDVLDNKAQQVAAVLRQVTGAADVQIKAPPGAPRLALRLHSDRLTALGFRPVEILEAMQTAFQGSVVAQTYRGNQVTDVAVLLTDAARREPEMVGALTLRNATGLRVPLSELAEIYPTSGRHAILHDGARRRQTVTCQAEGRNIDRLVTEARQQLSTKVSLPPGTYLTFTGVAAAAQAARRELLTHSAMAAAGIVLILALALRQARHVLLVLLNVPFALVGGVFAVALAGALGGEGEGGVNLGSLVGFVTLFGITMRNSIMLISHYEHLVQHEGAEWNPATARRGAAERLGPILMTALVTGLGLLPLALGSGEAGREIEGPMAQVILGGLVTSTLLNLLVLPSLALRYGRFTPPKMSNEQ
jgi:CzcA family heavy metal efflux pump